MMGRDSGRIEPAPAILEEPDTTDSPRPPWLIPAVAGLVIAAIGAGVAAGMSRSPKDGFAVAVGVLVVGLLFGALLRPPPLRDRPGDDTAIDFGRSEGGELREERGPSRAERRRKAKEERRR
jgi:hypothetical protein